MFKKGLMLFIGIAMLLLIIGCSNENDAEANKPTEVHSGEEVTEVEESSSIDSQTAEGNEEEEIQILPEEHQIEENAEFTNIGQWKVTDSRDANQTIQLVKQVNVNESHEFGGLRVEIKNVNIIKFIDPQIGIDKYSKVKVEEGKPLYGIEITYVAEDVRPSASDLSPISYPGISKIVTSEGQEIIQYVPDSTDETMWEEPDNFESSATIVGSDYVSNIISLLEYDTADDLSWIELDLGGMSTDGGYVEEYNVIYLEAMGPTVRVEF